ncbi:MAG: hypothetical protein V4695_00785 [Pseudomonadota bacterium]
MTSTKRWISGIAAAGMMLTLAGCGGGTDRSIGANGNGGIADDGFIAQVRALIALDGDSPDVLPFDSITVTTPEESEPVEI